MSAQEVKDLVDALEKASKLSSRGKSIKRVCNVFNSDHRVVSWKFNEWDYGKNNIQLPCNARGLFILDDKDTDPVIVARGYDKFFNVNEVLTTKWEWLQENTVGPYEATLKTNGCIIFISALKDGTLVVCSKHSTGDRDDSDRNHAEAGELYLRKQLHDKGIDINQFSKALYEQNLTAVAEYCDDTFEEHIIEYAPKDAGLYLHGLNLNQRDFKTLPIGKVAEFSDIFGFKKTDYISNADIHLLRKFLEDKATTGTYEGKEIEGFVVRSHLKNGADLFFKYKFEEPYLMYRQWREVTKDYIQNRTRVFNFRKHKFITNKYLDFVIPILDQNEELCHQYMKGLGVIDLRNRFIATYGMSAMEILNYEKVKELELKNSLDFSIVDENTKFLIIPIAVIGSGKTTCSLTLTNLYPESWGHVQNDEITGKDKSMLMKKSLQLLAKPNIKCVIVDRNNHQFRERKQLFDWVEQFKEVYLPYDTNIKVVGLSFAEYEDLELIRELTIARVFDRGDNHQSIKADKFGEKKVLGIMDGFLKRFQAVNEDRYPDNKFDFIIRLKVQDSESSIKNVKTILNELNKEYPILIPKVPSQSEIDIAFKRSLEYKPTVTKIVGSGGRNNGNGGNNEEIRQKKINPVYYSATIMDLQLIRSEILKSLEDSDLGEEEKMLIKNTVENKLQNKLHITLAHVGSSKRGTPEQQAIWKNYSNRYIPYLKTVFKSTEVPTSTEIITEDSVKFSIRKLCMDSKIFTAIVDINELGVLTSEGNNISNLRCSNNYSHITLGILKEGTKPFYSNELCEKVEAGSAGEDVKSWKISRPNILEAKVTINL
ncbi:hypothetical protein Kpol_463p3 [Vanderwaltozyma polyspora DSM 70294]|uniref:tRNA ligase n=1 Tax=Vanderwaltozyma polyspora (strain ATCC 22028 / DSM 70294 / BCRC 21397 / CBS 2163 / NBRC 10782 / NRRL Y-8283 / UCD 57-17) TaxID=436907 RepID=A7TQJ0_VANPO|nr:uncharacterized protein Kpol_463p3 [Vanderwaltozyma polyspora DSM 70294]EDO15454.1 hypothetical protein Kpol_463p3 [Vanderwaltozyma polyspora DSM 70294]